MTKETEGLFEYCKAAVRIATKDVNSGLTHFQVSEEKVIKELDELEAKLKEMEVYLTKGGIILDRNGKQCHVGDKVKWLLGDRVANKEIEGVLIFDDKYNQFYIYDAKSDYKCYPIKKYFELIKE